MTRSIPAVLLALGVLGSTVSPSAAQSFPGVSSGAQVNEPTRRPPARARTRITVAPAYPYRLESTPYPVPYPIEYPGPGYVRQCKSWLVTESRLSGAVVVPRMRCWWQPG